VNPSQLRWFARRLRRMSAIEIAWRVEDFGRQELWRHRQVRPGDTLTPLPAGHTRVFATPIDLSKWVAPPDAPRGALLAVAQDMLAGHWEVLGVRRDDMADPDWFFDPVSGCRFPDDRYAFRIDYRNAPDHANVKQVWELSRHHHLTVLAAAWWLTGEERCADMVEHHLRSWWRRNPFLSGINWSSGIELGIRLLAWVWVRRLLDGWPGAAALFEDNEEAVRQVRWHQQYLAAFRSRGSSANNHVIAEAAGQLVASCAFPWFAESDRWRMDAGRLLESELRRNTFASGVNREMAFDYHGLVTELGLLAVLESSGSGHPLSDETWQGVCRMLDAIAAVLDERLQAPRQGDSDDGRALVLDAPGTNRWASLLATGATVFGAAPWWPTCGPGVTSTVLTSFAPATFVVPARPARRPSHFDDAGLTILRTAPGVVPEIWCRCDGGPHGHLATAAHAHADALSIEVRCGGVEILADPGTYCYHSEPGWRCYFRSTVAHNTLELGGKDQSFAGGPFLWLRHARARTLEVVTTEGGENTRWTAEHTGYRTLDPPATHCRSVELNAEQRRLEVIDGVETMGSPAVRMAFHLGPTIGVGLEGHNARLTWATPSGAGSATMTLPSGLQWTTHRAEQGPMLGWYSERFGVKEPTTTLLGVGRCRPGNRELRCIIQFQ
jgi:hypothetical protein